MSKIQAFVLVFAFSLAGCQTSATPPESAAFSLASAQASEFSSRMSYGSYAIRPSDQLRVQIYDDANINGEYQVDGSGHISIPLAGRIKASGLTAAQLERAIAARLRNGVLKKPNVSVQIMSYGPVYVHGEVKRAGEFPYKPGLTVMAAVALAGGYTYRAHERTAYITRADSSIEQEYVLDRSIRIYPGDNIRIPERFF